MADSSVQEQQTSSKPERPSTHAHTDKKHSVGGWFKTNFVRKSGQDEYPNSKAPINFAPFGEVIQNPATHGGEPKLESVKANQGSATKWLDVTHMTNYYDLSESKQAARVVVNLFVCHPRELKEREGRMVFPVSILERHPFTPQTFIPTGVSVHDKNVRYLVIVAPTLAVQSERNQPTNYSLAATTSADHFTGPLRKGTGLPDLDNIKAFIAKGDQAVTYSAGTWHAPMVVLGEKPIDFVVVQYSNGVAEEDCQEFEIDVNAARDGSAVDVGEAKSLRTRL